MKVWYKSKTILFNIFTALIQIAVALFNSGLAFNPKWMMTLGIISTAGNVILRLQTTTAIVSQSNQDKMNTDKT